MLSLSISPGPAPDLVVTNTSSDIKGSTSCSCKSMIWATCSPCHHHRHTPPSRSSCLLDTLGFSRISGHDIYVSLL